MKNFRYKFLDKQLKMFLISGICIALMANFVGAAPDPDLINQSPGQTTPAANSQNGPILDQIEFNKTPMGEALKTIAQKSGLDIQIPSGLTVPVTVSLKNINTFDCLRIILEKNQLAYWDEKGVIQVMTQSEYLTRTGRAFDQEIRTVVFLLKNSSAAEIAPILWKTDSGRLYVDEKANALILIDQPDKLAAMEKTIATLDVPRRQEVFEIDPAASQEISTKVKSVLTPNIGKIKLNKRANKMTVTETEPKLEEIKGMLGTTQKKDVRLTLEARIVQVVLNDEHRDGVDWEAIVSDYRSLAIGKNQSADPATGESKDVKLSIGTLSEEDYEILLEALDTVGETNVLPAAKMKAQNREEIKLLIGSKETNILMTTTTPSSAAGANGNLNFMEVGMKLFVTPVLAYDDEGTVTLRIKPDPTVKEPSDSTNSAIETNIGVKKETTVVIGGLIEDEKIDTIKKIPLLGDIPIVGLAFRSQNENVRKTEWILFLTPKTESVAEDMK